MHAKTIIDISLIYLCAIIYTWIIITLVGWKLNHLFIDISTCESLHLHLLSVYPDYVKINFVLIP